MRLFRSFVACFSTYSRIPMPSVKLDSADMKYALAFFPVIGLIIGAIEYLNWCICRFLGLPAIFQICIAIIIPVIITGGIHIDGYMDTMDAFNSYGDRDKKLSIMKDPHAGAFAMIYLLVYVLVYAAFLSLLKEKIVIPFCLTFVISRILSGISVTLIPGAKKTGMVADVKTQSANKVVLICLIIEMALVIAILFFYGIVYAASVIFISATGYIFYRKKCIKELMGITGDTSGYFLCIMELVLLVAISLEGYL